MMFVNNCVGDVLLTVACRFSHLGLPLGVIVLTFCFLIQCYGFSVISEACALTGADSLLALVEAPYGRRMAMFIDVCAVMMLVGVVICYVIIISEYIEQALELMIGELGENTFTIIKAIVGFVALPPLGFITSVKVLDFISSFAAVFVVITVVVILVRFS